MDIDKIISDVTTYAESNPLIAGAAGLVLLFMLIKKPKILIAVIVLALLWVAVMKIVSGIFEAGTF